MKRQHEKRVGKEDEEPPREEGRESDQTEATPVCEGPRLWVVATPIGNLEDITLRALRILRDADLVAAEDTRRTGQLLAHYGIHKPLVSCHRFNEAQRLSGLLASLREGKRVALVSDAGMPGISDPGERLLRRCVEEGIRVEVIPGPSSVLAALLASGFSTTPFYFGGFLPVKGGARTREWAAAGARACTSVYFESPHRLRRSLEEAAPVLGSRRICLARELTKKFEEVLRGSTEALLAEFQGREPRGEFCIVVEGAEEARRASGRNQGRGDGADPSLSRSNPVV
ncbi:16S rRNA (cytidine(1402)-2'-O)-methyltransferase [Methylacidimicrobium tartarophylax]|uniref:Ribosomal RNA small subunit methyltransferase I n=1 Tax=Methylacidimicrobium tartarophylax TaxID=1041768 RepID=A0A5E6MDS8_9BACT|nr:16S rRNA (cytidine(1402)-2'-O)-methyltransferase [Methylacidimicrobium tartarophylax]VVM07263.1 Ribosomal RNA small subunit methyltransferase I [Methylacidimicrobium tartarophylax]